jgi:hypothetical protein
MKASSASQGLQLVDICLYLICHKEIILQNYQDNPSTAYLLMYIITHGTAFDFTLNGFIRESNEFHKKIMSLPLTEDELKRGQKVVDEIEETWKENFLKVGKQ